MKVGTGPSNRETDQVKDRDDLDAMSNNIAVLFNNWLSSGYYVLGNVLSTLQVLSHLILMAIPLVLFIITIL